MSETLKPVSNDDPMDAYRAQLIQQILSGFIELDHEHQELFLKTVASYEAQHQSGQLAKLEGTT